MQKQPQWLIVVKEDEKLMQEYDLAPERNEDEKLRNVKYLTIDELKDYPISTPSTARRSIYLFDRYSQKYSPFVPSTEGLDDARHHLLLVKGMALKSVLKAMGAKKIDFYKAEREYQKTSVRVGVGVEVEDQGGGDVQVRTQQEKEKELSVNLRLESPNNVPCSISEIENTIYQYGLQGDSIVQNLFNEYKRHRGFPNGEIQYVKCVIQEELKTNVDVAVNISVIAMGSGNLQMEYEKINKSSMMLMLAVTF